MREASGRDGWFTVQQLLTETVHSKVRARVEAIDNFLILVSLLSTFVSSPWCKQIVLPQAGLCSALFTTLNVTAFAQQQSSVTLFQLNTRGTIAVNALCLLSVVFSLVAALLATQAKQEIQDHKPRCSILSRVQCRSIYARHLGLIRRKSSVIVTILSVLLLLFFFVGLACLPTPNKFTFAPLLIFWVFVFAGMVHWCLLYLV